MALTDASQIMIRGQQELGQSGVNQRAGSYHGFGATIRGPGSSADILRRAASRPRSQQVQPRLNAQQAFDQLAAQVGGLRRQVQQLQSSGPGVLGGPVFGGSRDANMSPFVDSPMIGVGGVLTSDAIELAAGAVAGTTASAGFSGISNARLQGTIIELFSLTGDDELQQVAERLAVTVDINGREFRTLDLLPADLVFPTALGEQQTVPAAVHVPPTAIVTVTVTVLQDLPTDAPHQMFGRVYSGNGSDFRAWGG